MTIFNYTVNLFDVGIVVLILVAAIVGWHRGFAVSIVNFIRYSFGMFLCFYASSNLSQPIYELYVKQRLVTMINEKIVVSNNIDETINNLNSYIKNLPPVIANTVNLKGIDISSSDNTESILTNIFEPFVLVLIKIAVFLGVMIVFFGITGLILGIISHHMKKKDKKRGGSSPLKKTDKALGLVFGIVKSFIIILAISAVLMYFIDLDEKVINDTAFFKEASESTLLKGISEINPFNAITEGLL